MIFSPPSSNCPFCPRLAAFRAQNRQEYPGFFNAPVPSFGELGAELLIVGLAPGLQGANATGRPFTGDYAGDILYRSLLSNGFATGSYSSPRGEQISGIYKDHLTLVNCRISNAVRCVPPENKPETSEIKTCNSFLKSEMGEMKRLKMVLSLGLVSHNAVLMATGHKAGFAKFAHGAMHRLGNGLVLANSYHCSRYNINTNRLSQEMFDTVVGSLREALKAAA
ncbi:MAG: uracil-DNA glycosylase [Rickettsiales bacterium]|nr:uracil-DNA glycosylase [Rickettsiales bacterium]